MVLDDILGAYGKSHAFLFGLGLSTGFNGILGLAAPVVFGGMSEVFGRNHEVLYTAGKTLTYKLINLLFFIVETNCYLLFFKFFVCKMIRFRSTFSSVVQVQKPQWS